MNTTNIGQTIRDRRESRGLKVYELAILVCVDPVYITQIELHNKLPSLRLFTNIYYALDFEKDFFIQYLNTKYPELFTTLARINNSTVDDVKEMPIWPLFCENYLKHTLKEEKQ